MHINSAFRVRTATVSRQSSISVPNQKRQDFEVSYGNCSIRPSCWNSMSILLVTFALLVTSSVCSVLENENQLDNDNHKPLALELAAHRGYHDDDGAGWLFRGLIVLWTCFCLIGLAIFIFLALCFCPKAFPCESIRHRKIVIFSLPQRYRERDGLYTPGNRCYNLPISVYQVPGKIYFVPPPEPVQVPTSSTAAVSSAVASFGAKATKAVSNAASTAHTVFNNLMPKYESSRGKVYSTPSAATAGVTPVRTTTNYRYGSTQGGTGSGGAATPMMTDPHQQQSPYNPHYS